MLLTDIFSDAIFSSTCRINFDECLPPNISNKISGEAISVDIINTIFFSNLNLPIDQETVASAWASLLCLRHTKLELIDIVVQITYVCLVLVNFMEIIFSVLLRLNNMDEAVDCITSLISWTVRSISVTEENSWSRNLLHVFCQAVLCLIDFTPIKDVKTTLPMETLMTMPKYCFHHEGFLYAFNFYIEHIKQSDPTAIFSISHLHSILSLLISNFSSTVRSVSSISSRIFNIV